MRIGKIMVDKEIFNQAFERVIGHEGGFQKMHDDLGNWTSGIVGKGELKGTKYGISAMSFPTHDIENLTLEQAKVIYYTRYWLPLKSDSLSPAIRYQIFDAAVNHGIRNTVKMLQRAVNVDVDGLIGKHTIAATNNRKAIEVIMAFIAERISFYTQIKTFDKYGKGWMNRISENLKYAQEGVK